MASSVFVWPGAFVYNGSTITLGASSLVWPLGTTLAEASSGKLTLTGTAPTIQLGGTSSSFPGLRQSGAAVEVILADASAYGALTAASLSANGNGMAISGTGGALFLGGGGSQKLIIGTAPTISSGFGTSASIAASNGTAAFTVNVGTGGTASSGVIGLPTASNGWIVKVENLTATAANRTDQRTVQTAKSTTSVTVQNQTISTGAALAWTASDTLVLTCFAY
jgi:hypothetical protein